MVRRSSHQSRTIDGLQRARDRCQNPWTLVCVLWPCLLFHLVYYIDVWSKFSSQSMLSSFLSTRIPGWGTLHSWIQSNFIFPHVLTFSMDDPCRCTSNTCDSRIIVGPPNRSCKKQWSSLLRVASISIAQREEDDAYIWQQRCVSSGLSHTSLWSLIRLTE